MEKENSEPNTKKRRLSLSRKKKKMNDVDRFADIPNETLESMATYNMPKNSALNSKWAMNNLNDWFVDYNTRHPDKRCPPEILSPSCLSKDLLNKWFSVFISETRNQRGEPYPPKSLYNMTCAIVREMRTQNAAYPNFMNKQDPAFTRFTNTMDNLFKSLRAAGVGSCSNPTEGISNDEEKLLWSSGVLDTKTPKGLVRAAFYYCGKCFCLRGGQEHRELSLSQLERLQNPARYVYRENASKNKQGGIRQIKLEHKVVTITANPSVAERCPVYILDQYISKLPAKAKEKDLFYCRPLENVPKDPSAPWFADVPIGKNILRNMVRDLCEEAGIEGKKTNHSLRVSGAINLYAAGVPEKVIQSRTGHSSLEALRKYERISIEQEEAVSKILIGESVSFECADAEKLPITTVPSAYSNKPNHGSSSVTPAHGVQYNDCVVNIYQNMSPPACVPYPSPYGYPPYYPEYPPLGPPSNDYSKQNTEK